jgi:DNA-binding response OmpR family regulator
MFMKEGFDDYLPKPLQIRELEEILRKHLSGY